MGSQFEDTFENTQWRKVILVDMKKRTVEKRHKKVTSVTLHLFGQVI